MNGSIWMVNVTMKTPLVGLLEDDVQTFLSRVKPLSRLAQKKNQFGREYNVWENLEHVRDAVINDDIFPVMIGSVELYYGLAVEDFPTFEFLLRDIFALANNFGFTDIRAKIRRNFWYEG